MITINLIKEPAARKGFRIPKEIRLEYFIWAAVVLAFIGSAFWYWSLTSAREEALAKREELEQQSLQLVALQRQVQLFEQQKLELEERIGIIEQLKATQSGPVMMMNAIIKGIPDEPRLWLTGMTQEGNRLTLQGKAFDVPAIASFVSILSDSRPFTSVELDYWEEGEESVDFELSCTVETN